jgi:hypothetical protein
MASQPSGRTRVKSLRKKYGPKFAKRYRSDMKLSTLLKRTRSKDLKEYLRKQKRR